MDSTMTKVAAVRAARNVRQSQRAGLVDATSAALALEAHERHAITARLKERHEASEEITSAGGVDLGLMLPLYAGGFGIQAYSNHALNAASYFQREVGELLEVLAKGSNTGPECGRLVRCPVPPRFVVRCSSCVLVSRVHPLDVTMLWMLLQDRKFGTMFMSLASRGVICVALYMPYFSNSEPAFVLTGVFAMWCCARGWCSWLTLQVLWQVLRMTKFSRRTWMCSCCCMVTCPWTMCLDRLSPINMCITFTPTRSQPQLPTRHVRELGESCSARNTRLCQFVPVRCACGRISRRIDGMRQQARYCMDA